ncbi:OmpH family outer membrane protein [uncultured Roseovarius sp.]|uniref:OmpH family outer membrane protein n=1 Tax=uncultured Roseovarius sp. TaxID=293344 RepID=UPI0025DD3E04|nr:OmpH family outer membrane protein [uncultured Roseovarius sp.]
MTLLRRVIVAGVMAGALIGAPGPAVQAQDVGVVQSDILVLDPERLFSETELGQRMTSEYQAAREALSKRNRGLEAELEAEEQALTEQRETLSPEAFRQLADEFDTKVQRIRRESDAAVRNLERRWELAPVSFMRRVEPVLVQVMQEAGGVVVLDARSVLLRADVVDITGLAASRINEEIGEGQAATGAQPPVAEDVTPQDAAPEEAEGDQGDRGSVQEAPAE